ncbi:MAG: NUDIX domain-containing protein [Parcubacteria group bacterium]|jgi:8-oxo-dGTP pyrophosphatase MutT (NUDIX family)
MKIVNRDIVAAIIVSKEGKIFQGTKNPDKGGVYSDCWHIPGGGIEKGESPEQALVREIKEETGIDVTPYKMILIDDLGKGESEKILKETGERVLCKMKFLVYRVEIKDKLADEIEVFLNDDLEKYTWTDIAELKNKKLTPPSVELFQRLGYI